jgi:hypothetical protein
MKRLISTLNNSDCNHNNYSHIWTFLKVGLASNFVCQFSALMPVGVLWKLTAPTVQIYISPPFDTRHSHYSSIWQKTFILVPVSTQELYITPPFYTRPYIHNSLKTNWVFWRYIFIYHFVAQTEWIFCCWHITNPSVCRVVITDYGKSEVKRWFCFL